MRNKSCKQCKAKKPADEMKIINMSNFCDMNCAITYGIEASKKLRAKKEKTAHAKRKSDFKLNDKALRTKEAQKAFNSFIRKRDEKEPCISCDKPNNGLHQRHASHYRSVGSCSSLRFNELNVHASCMQCNSHLSGNISEYRIRLIRKIGVESVDWLESHNKITRYTCEELKAIEMKYKSMLK